MSPLLHYQRRRSVPPIAELVKVIEVDDVPVVVVVVIILIPRFDVPDHHVLSYICAGDVRTIALHML